MKIIVQHILDKCKENKDQENENNILAKLAGLSNEVEQSHQMREMGKIAGIGEKEESNTEEDLKKLTNFYMLETSLALLVASNSNHVHQISHRMVK